LARFPAAEKAIARLRKWAQRPDWSGPLSEIVEMHVGPACTALGIEAETLFAALDDHSLAMVMGNVLEDLIACEFDDDLNIVDDYLARRGWKESAPGKRWLKALRHSRASLWEVVALDPGRSMTVKDLLAGGEPVVVDERMGSRSAALWDRAMARLVTVDGRAYMSGAVLLFKAEAADAVLERFERALKEVRRKSRRAARRAGEPPPEDAVLRAALLQNAAPVLTQEWLIHAYKAATAPPPDLINAEGHAFMFAEVRFPLLAEAGEARARLDRHPAFERDEGESRWSWVGSGGPAPSPTPPAAASKPGETIRLLSDDALGRPLLGSARIEAGLVILEANSRERAERGRELLADALSGLAGEPEAVFRSPAEVMSEAGDPPAPVEPDLPPEVRAEIIRHHIEDHYRKTLDDGLPLFDGKSPRQAARTKKGRQAVISWLKQMENHEARRAATAGETPCDLTWMWSELGVADLRR
jgi:hypothetical protein